MKRHKTRIGRTIQIILLIFSIEVLMIISGIVYVQLRPMVVETVTMEAGEEALNLEQFLLYKNRKGSFMADVLDLNLNNPGNYEIKIKIGNRIYTSSLQIIDTKVPTATIVDQMVLKDEAIEAKAFATEIQDVSNVTVTFKEAPNTSILGDQDVTIILEDNYQNRMEQKAILTVLDIKNSVFIEAGSQMDITVDDFVDNDKYKVEFVTDLSKLDISKPTVHKIAINVDGRIVYSAIEVVDTTPPKATFVKAEVWKDEVPTAISFVTDIEDASGVEVTYKEIPDFTKVGDQEVTIILEDDSGNYNEKKGLLIVKEDTQPPEIIGTRDKTVYVGDTLAYRKDVLVKDNRDKDLKVTIDSSKVNLKKEGVYNVLYSAKDSAGNTTSVTVTVTVIKYVITEAMVNDVADDILAKITKDTMTKKEVAHEIYVWVKKHVSYTGSSDKSDWLAEAYRGMKNGVGDCFTFYAVSQALLTRADIDNMGVTRVGGRTHHFWNLIDCGNGWYHFDTCPNKDHKETFMLTDKEVEEYTKKRGNHYYSFDKSLYPETPVE